MRDGVLDRRQRRPAPAEVRELDRQAVQRPCVVERQPHTGHAERQSQVRLRGIEPGHRKEQRLAAPGLRRHLPRDDGRCRLRPGHAAGRRLEHRAALAEILDLRQRHRLAGRVEQIGDRTALTVRTPEQRDEPAGARVGRPSNSRRSRFPAGSCSARCTSQSRSGAT